MTRYPYNLHTHTTYCDGGSTAVEMAKAAYKKGFKTLGFSGHSVLPWYEAWPMSEENEKKYIIDVNNLKKEYEGRMEIVLGLELDSQSVYSPEQLKPYSYIIGSIHAVKAPDNKSYYVDCDASMIERGIEVFGNIENFCEKYYEDVIKTAKKDSTDILGHFDLILKYNDKAHFLDENAKWYRDLALSAADEVAKTGVIVEMNTGAISRNARAIPYPTEEIIKRFNEKGTKFVLSSDAHFHKAVDCFFNESLVILKNCGVKTIIAYENGSFIEKEL